MNSWYRRLQVLLCIGGGFMGFVLTLRSFVALKSTEILVYIPYPLFAIIFVYAIVLGLLLSESSNCRRHLILLYSTQLFTVYSPLLTYHNYVGMDWFVGIQSWKFIYDFGLGAGWTGAILRSFSWGIGIDLFALVVIIIEVVAWIRRSHTVLVNTETTIQPIVEPSAKSL